jgi:imidazolonepropionase-like amidohydrolase
VPGVLRGIDLIALDGNPLREIDAVRRVAFVMKGGKVFRDH